MSGRSLLNVLTSNRDGRVDPSRDCAFTGRERHVRHADGGGYPCRAIRTDDYLYIRNLKPERWPAGEPDGYGDVDGGPTKTYMLGHRDEESVARYFALGFGRRPEEEFYDLRTDPNQLANVADQPAYASVRQALRARLEARMASTGDRRVTGGAEMWETLPYYGQPAR
jgi:arylsulfatase A-like enzyme